MRIKGTCITVDQLLDAAEEVVLRDGVNGLTLEAVAAQAEVSKGGLLYHFHTKERLIAAMVERIVGQWREHLRQAVESVPPGPGRVPRGFLNMCCAGKDAADAAAATVCGGAEAAPTDGGDAGWDQCVRRASVVMLAALTENPSLVQPLRDLYAEVNDAVNADGLRPGYAEVVLAALDGLWFSRIFNLNRFPPDRLVAMRRCLEETVQRGVDPAASGSPAAMAAAAIPARPSRRMGS